MEESKPPINQETIVDLQRKIRFMSNNIRQYNQQVQTQTKKQRGQIQKLKKENAALREESNSLQKAGQSRPASRPHTVLEPIQSYQDKIDQQKQKIIELDKDIKIIQEKMFKQREQMGGINASKDTANALNKQLRILQNRLDKANQKFNQAIAHNKQLREEIDNLRRERVIFDKIYQKLQEELQNKRKEMANIIEQANSAYQDRDRAQDQLSALKQLAQKQHLEFEKEWKQLNSLIEKDKKMKDFLKLKQKQRQHAQHIQQHHRTEQQTMKKKKTSPSQITMQRVKSYQQAFNKIQSATGITNIDQLVTTFIKAQDKNFTLFKFVNQLSNQIQHLQKVIADLQLELVNHKMRDQSATLQRKKIQLQQKQNKYAHKAELYELKFQQAHKTIDSLKREIDVIFSQIDCSSYLAQEFLGEAVNEGNMEQYLTLIEQRTSQIFQAYAIMQLQQERRDFVLPGPQLPPSSNPPRIEAPVVRDDLSDQEDDEVEDDKPLTLEEFKQRAEKRAQQLQFIQKNKFKASKGRHKKQGQKCQKTRIDWE